MLTEYLDVNLVNRLPETNVCHVNSHLQYATPIASSGYENAVYIAERLFGLLSIQAYFFLPVLGLIGS